MSPPPRDTFHKEGIFREGGDLCTIMAWLSSCQHCVTCDTANIDNRNYNRILYRP